jgi:hypothetical protein
LCIHSSPHSRDSESRSISISRGFALSASSFLSAVTLSLRSGGKDQAGRVSGVHAPGLLPEAGRPGLDAGTSRFEGFSHPANTSGIQSIPSSATTPFRMALSSRKASWLWSGAHRGSYCDAPSVSQLLQAVSEELQESEHVLIPDEHRNAAQVTATLLPSQLSVYPPDSEGVPEADLDLLPPDR